MKNLFFLFSLLLFACSSEIKDEAIVDNQNSIVKDYQDASLSINNSLTNANNAFGLAKNSRTSAQESTILDVILEIPEKKLDSLINTPKFKDVLSNREARTDKYIDTFFEFFSINDYNWLKNSLIYYLSTGGHNTDLLIKLTKDIENETLIRALVYSSAYADRFACAEFWKDSEYKLSKSNEGGLYGGEYECRRILQMSLCLISLDGGTGVALDMALGAIPGVAELEALAAIAGGADAVCKYLECVGHARGAWN